MGDELLKVLSRRLRAALRQSDLLVRISGRRTVLLSTHIVADVEASCTGLAVLRQGRLAFAGTPEELVERARGRVWQVEVEPGEWDEVAARVASGPDPLAATLRPGSPAGPRLPSH